MRHDSTQVKRTREIEEVTNLYLVHPVSRTFVTYFARWGVHPNVVSVVGMVLGAAAAAAYYQYEHWPMALLGFALMVGWHVMDGVDGQLARLTGQTSDVGKVLDGLCDHVTFTLVYASLALASAQEAGGWVWALAVAAGVSHLLQASAYEFQRQAYDFWGYGKETARPVTPEAYSATLDDKRGLERSFGMLYLGYLEVQHRMAGVQEDLSSALGAALDEADADAEERIRAAYRTVQRSGVRRWGLLCSNYRTIAIFVACLAGSPVYFFLFEILLLNAVFLLLRRMQHRRNRALRTRLAALPSLEALPL